MYSHDELKGLHGFLRSTGEGHLKKLLVGGSLTDVHLRILLKIARSVSEDEFVTYFEGATFPKIKWSAAESAAKEKMWFAAADAFVRVGLLNPNTGAAKKAA